MREDERLKFSEVSEVCDEPFGPGADFVPDGVKLLAHEGVERAEEGVLDGEVFDFELLTPSTVSTVHRNTFQGGGGNGRRYCSS